MSRITSLYSKFAWLLLPGFFLILGLAGCSPELIPLPATHSPALPSGTPAAPVMTPASPTIAPSPASTPTPEITLTPTITPTQVLPEDIYPEPTPFLQPAAWPGAAMCPNRAGVEEAGSLPADGAIATLNLLYSGEMNSMRKASDQSYWPLVQMAVRQEEPLQPDWLEIRPAKESSYQGLLRWACGDEILNLSWEAVDCKTVCSSPDRPAALAEHYFLIRRKGQWLVWASYP